MNSQSFLDWSEPDVTWFSSVDYLLFVGVTAENQQYKEIMHHREP